MTTTPELPASLPSDGDGARFWTRCTEAIDGWTVHDLELLEQVCAVRDTISLLSTALVGAPLIVKGANRQDLENPLLSELRQQRSLHARLLKQLALPDDATLAEVRDRQASMSARTLARRRWTG